MIELLLCAEKTRGSLITHLNKVPHRQIGQSVRILFSPGKVSSKGAFAIVRHLCEAFIEHHTVFEGGVHALPIEWDNGMSCIADESDFILIEPWGASNSN